MVYFYILVVINAIVLDGFVSCLFYKGNTTDLSKCNVSYSRTGSAYIDFYPIHTKENESLILDFHFAVLATSDAHILLAESETISKNDPAYEIVIGAGGNTFCDIRRMQKSDVRHSVRIKGLLSALDPQFFWLHITKDGTGGRIQVGREGENASFIDWLDPEPLPVKFISFSTWSGIEAKWYFDCDRSQNEEEIEKKLSALEKLRRNLLYMYDPMVRPVIDRSTVTEVFMTLNIDYLELDEYKSNIEMRGTTTLRWHDEKLNWDPRDYDDIASIHAARQQIWKPEITCFSALDNPSDVLQDAMIVVNNTGEVLWKPAIHVTAFCNGVQSGDWPKEIHACKIMFRFSMDYGNTLLYFNESDSYLLEHASSQWSILEASVFDVEVSNVTNEIPSVGIFVALKRSSAIYSTVFFLPFIVIGTCLLLSFWIPLNGPMKISMGCSQIIMEIIMLLALADFVPHSSGGVPFLVVLYSWCLVGSLISLILSIIIINLSKKKKPKPLHHIICNILTTKFVKTILWLPNIVKPEDYGDLNISLSFSNLSKTEDKGQHFWTLLGIAIDRLSFLIYAPIIVIVAIKYMVS